MMIIILKIIINIYNDELKRVLLVFLVYVYNVCISINNRLGNVS
jgi:hypothetical protein